jgi:CheY-like chemotaxis protein
MKSRILVVDDDHLVADTLTLVLQANGFETGTAYSAAEGLANARHTPPGLLLCDISMPDQTGLQLIETITREQPNCRMMVLTAYSSNALHVQNKSEELNLPIKMLRKPCRPEELVREARALLNA